ncbi:helix-turn-helix transcriptional regulator [Streptomyces xanthophaeus]|uniref:helix-turn-helix transcriptional regulator n=1 Tax=Streptomyces xanthophaeus TaxID=67385 RepID=UPI0026476702|nr:helix-turn-helix transcriptional regulator [Streptomyces xanthophaeus]WKD33863.1 LuxR C-terminal-related transcriptional regulator [Streptomyces xanthophaeus]
MLSGLGIDSVAEVVYRTMLSRPEGGVADWADSLGLPADAVRDALDRLSRLALVRRSTEDHTQVRPVNPLLGLEALLAQQQAELAAHQQRVEASRAVVAETMAQFAHQYAPGAGAGFHYVAGVDAIREQIEILTTQVQEEFLTFAPGGPQTPENMVASRPLNLRLLEQGIRMRTVYLDSIRRDAPTVAHAEWLVAHGGMIRTAPSLPNRLILVDQRIALIATDSQNTGAGAVMVENAGTITLISALFESVWQSAQPLGVSPERAPEDLTSHQAEVLRLMARGLTDDAIAHQLGVSARTVRRTVSGLLTQLEARSRFQAGVEAVRRGHLDSAAE